MDIEFTPEALDDLERLRQFLLGAGAPCAEEIASDIIQGLQHLRLFPRMGLCVRQAPDPDAIRDWYIGKYCARYLIVEDAIYILRIWHGREDERNRIT